MAVERRKDNMKRAQGNDRKFKNRVITAFEEL